VCVCVCVRVLEVYACDVKVTIQLLMANVFQDLVKSTIVVQCFHQKSFRTSYLKVCRKRITLVDNDHLIQI
jgi:hypothetical protein